MMQETKTKLTTREGSFEGSPLIVISDGLELYVLPEQLASHLGLPWEKPQRTLSRDFDPAAFGGPPLRAFRDMASEVIPLFLLRQWVAEMLKLTIRRNPEYITEMQAATLLKLKKFCACGERTIYDSLA